MFLIRRNESFFFRMLIDALCSTEGFLSGNMFPLITRPHSADSFLIQLKELEKLGPKLKGIGDYTPWYSVG